MRSSTSSSAEVQNAGTSRAISFSARSLKSSVSSMPANVSRSSMSRMTAGSTKRSALGTGICMMTKAATLLSPVCIGLAVTTASAVPAVGEPDRQDGVSFPVRLHGIEQCADRIACGDVAEVNSEQVARGTCQNLRSSPVVLDDPAGTIYSEDQGSHRRVRVHVDYYRRCLTASPFAGCHGRLLKIGARCALANYGPTGAGSTRSSDIFPLVHVSTRMPQFSGGCWAFWGE